MGGDEVEIALQCSKHAARCSIYSTPSRPDFGLPNLASKISLLSSWILSKISVSSLSPPICSIYLSTSPSTLSSQRLNGSQFLVVRP